MKRGSLVVQTKLARFTEKVVTIAQKAVAGQPKQAFRKGEGGYADWVIVSIHAIREYLDQPYRRLMEILYEMPRITRIIGLLPSTLPDFSTVCGRKQELKMNIWRPFLGLTIEFHELGEIQAIDATGMDRIAASQHYAKRTNYTFRAVKTTILVDCATGVILDIHCSMTQPHDSQVGWQVLKRNLDKLSTITADKGYDWWLLSNKLRAEGVKPLIRRREFGWEGVAENALMNDKTYHQRSNVEATFFALRQRFGGTLRARTWFGQFRELVLKCAVRNVELAVRASNP